MLLSHNECAKFFKCYIGFVRPLSVPGDCARCPIALKP